MSPSTLSPDITIFPSLPFSSLPNEIRETNYRCVALFEGLSPDGLLAASGPSDSWECLGVGVTLFEREDPFWWRREHPEDEERRQEALAAHNLKRSKARRLLDGLEGEFDGKRRCVSCMSTTKREKPGRFLVCCCRQTLRPMTHRGCHADLFRARRPAEGWFRARAL